MITYPPSARVHIPADIPRTVTLEPRYGGLKRAFDLVGAALATVFILSWMIPLVSALIWLTSRGPALFVQLRTGRDGRRFRCLKFRTMVYDPQAPFQQATQDDPRVTSVGRFLRRTNLDEMPQFLNVLLGDMSIVGPRPHAIHHDAEYWFSMPGYRDRYVVKPGITGLAQVRGYRGVTSERIQMEHRVRYDHFYIQHQSLALDLRICWWTARKMVSGDEQAR